MNNSAYQKNWEKLVFCVKSSIPQGSKTAFWLLKLMIPISFVVFILDFLGFLNIIAVWFAPIFNLIGLSGQASIVLITGFFTSIYSVIAVITTLGIGHREGTILAVMCLISHSLIVETAIQKKTGSSAWRMVTIRLLSSLIAAWFLNRYLPIEQITSSKKLLVSNNSFEPLAIAWLYDMAIMTIKIIVLVNILLIFQKILREFNLIKWILLPFKPLLKLMGLPPNTGFLWMIAYTIGLSYGGAIMISESEEGKLEKREADLLNHHIGISHSILEDTLLFVAIGYNFFILALPRIILSIIVVWIRKAELYFRKK